MVRKRDNAAERVTGFVFDLASGRPLSRAWQADLGGDTAVYQFFSVDDCQQTKPLKHALVMGTATDWHRMGLNLVRARGRRKGGTLRCAKPAKN